MDTFVNYNISHDTVVTLANLFAPDPDGPLVPFHADIRLSVPNSTQRVTVRGTVVGPGIVGKAVGFRFVLADGQHVNALPADIEWISRSPQSLEGREV